MEISTEDVLANHYDTFKPFKCSVCNKQFLFRGQLERHLCTHAVNTKKAFINKNTEEQDGEKIINHPVNSKSTSFRKSNLHDRKLKKSGKCPKTKVVLKKNSGKTNVLLGSDLLTNKIKDGDMVSAKRRQESNVSTQYIKDEDVK